MSDIKCPKCGGRLVYWGATGALLKCEQCKFGWGNEELWQKLIRTRKALEIAVDALNKIANTDIKVIEKEPLYYARAMFSVTNNALGRIQDIKQKDVK